MPELNIHETVVVGFLVVLGLAFIVCCIGIARTDFQSDGWP